MSEHLTTLDGTVHPFEASTTGSSAEIVHELRQLIHPSRIPR